MRNGGPIAAVAIHSIQPGSIQGCFEMEVGGSISRSIFHFDSCITSIYAPNIKIFYCDDENEDIHAASAMMRTFDYDTDDFTSLFDPEIAD